MSQRYGSIKAATATAQNYLKPQKPRRIRKVDFLVRLSEKLWFVIRFKGDEFHPALNFNVKRALRVGWEKEVERIEKWRKIAHNLTA